VDVTEDGGRDRGRFAVSDSAKQLALCYKTNFSPRLCLPGLNQAQ
jgi:hypothetical protein